MAYEDTAEYGRDLEWCKECGGILPTEENFGQMLDDDYADLCECAEARADLRRKHGDEGV